MRGFRRTMSSISVVVLIVGNFNKLPDTNYYNRDIMTIINEKKAQVTQIIDRFKVDRDLILVK
jgi:hypothetical protein